MHPSLRWSPIALAVAIVGASPPAVSDTAVDTGFLQCVYECKLFPPAAPSFYQEQTTLMIVNGDQPTSLPPHPVTRVAHLAFLDASEKILGRGTVDLTPRDLDEVNACHTIAANMGMAPPPAGVVLVGVVDVGTPGQVSVGRDVDVSVKNPVGRMSLSDPEIFNGRVVGIGRMPCFEVNRNPFRLIDSFEYQQAPEWEPTLIERTADPDRGS
ncbi:MAG: hypothetical protein QNK03_02470 [Myxococcota bacterium]|nr:hypothetical protein [Myxococcota bacterium]